MVAVSLVELNVAVQLELVSESEVLEAVSLVEETEAVQLDVVSESVLADSLLVAWLKLEVDFVASVVVTRVCDWDRLVVVGLRVWLRDIVAVAVAEAVTVAVPVDLDLVALFVKVLVALLVAVLVAVEVADS